MRRQYNQNRMQKRSRSRKKHAFKQGRAQEASPLPALFDSALWPTFLALFSHNLDQMALTARAIVRRRQIRSAEILLRLLFFYVLADLPLRAVVTWAAQLDLATLTDTALEKRFQHSTTFLRLLLADLLNRHLEATPAPGATVRLVDATTLSFPGSCQADLRIHAEYSPQTARLVSVDVTDVHTAEALDRHSYQAGNLILADRGLARPKDFLTVLENGADFLLRVYVPTLRFLDEAGQVLSRQELLSRAQAGAIDEEMLLPLPDQSQARVRLLMIPLPVEEAEKARKKLRQKAKRQGKRVTAQGLAWAGYLCLLTSIPKERISAEGLQACYRIRWQIELFFKRCKSLLGLGRLKKSEEKLAQIHSLGKLLVAVLVEEIRQQEVGPEGEEESKGILWRTTQLAVLTLQLAIYGGREVNWRWLKEPAIRKRLQERPRKRKLAASQVSSLFDWFLANPAQEDFNLTS